MRLNDNITKSPSEIPYIMSVQLNAIFSQYTCGRYDCESSGQQQSVCVNECCIDRISSL